MVSTAPAPKPPSSSENGSPHRPPPARAVRAGVVPDAFAPAALLRHVFLARIEIVGAAQEAVDAFLEKPLLLGQIKIHVTVSPKSTQAMLLPRPLPDIPP